MRSTELLWKNIFGNLFYVQTAVLEHLRDLTELSVWDEIILHTSRKCAVFVIQKGKTNNQSACFLSLIGSPADTTCSVNHKAANTL